ncbi:MAG: 4-oxalocrotonate tautomerase [Betaproteobacteria bacterium HGW-Betaproteobacteria-7]|jgi:4-oxalocrotonate tautomerase family enzyme|nr:MAG: 4-oxalocrotonate tautomerase [Betaproteobacteria bacterium HGW-Betaproteobacteria-7]
MPVANLHVLAGHPRESLKNWVRESSRALSDILAAPMDRLEVWVTEIDPELWGIGGDPASEVLAHTPRREAEMPLIQMVLMEGRTVEQLHRVIGELSAITARLLDVDQERIRVHIAHAHPERWGIGGMPASIRRAAELAARQAPTG